MFFVFVIVNFFQDGLNIRHPKLTKERHKSFWKIVSGMENNMRDNIKTKLQEAILDFSKVRENLDIIMGQISDLMNNFTRQWEWDDLFNENFDITNKLAEFAYNGKKWWK